MSRPADRKYKSRGIAERITKLLSPFPKVNYDDSVTHTLLSESRITIMDRVIGNKGISSTS
jgi:hypothetical protein